MKAYVEQINPRAGFSWRYLNIREPSMPFEWHYHFEYELVLHRDCSGIAYVGDGIEHFGHNTLTLMAPRLPHSFVTSRLHNHASTADTHVIWFSQYWIDQMATASIELKSLKPMLQKSGQGLRFSPECGEAVYELMRSLCLLSPAQQLSRLLQTLILLSENEAQHTYSAHSSTQEKDDPAEVKKIEMASRYIQTHFVRPLTIGELADHMYMSESSVRRLFKRHFGEVFSVHLKKHRLGQACHQLINTSQPIALVAENVGFNNLSNFNRQFKAAKKMTPKEFRTHFEQRGKKGNN